MGVGKMRRLAGAVCLALVLLMTLFSTASGLSCYQDHGNWTSPSALGPPETCPEGAYCRSVTIQKVYLYDCAVTCKTVASETSIPKNVTNPKRVVTSVYCCQKDGCNQVAPFVKAGNHHDHANQKLAAAHGKISGHSGATTVAPSMVVGATLAILAVAAQTWQQ